jgi:hypothetical protein
MAAKKKVKKETPVAGDMRVFIAKANAYDGSGFKIQEWKVWKGWSGETSADWRSVWYTSTYSTMSCCGFQELTEYRNPTPAVLKWIKAHSDEVVSQFKAWCETHHYLVAYVPDTKDYTLIRELMEAVGWKKVATLPSKHGRGRYTNTCWNWFGPKYNPNPKVKRNEKAVSALDLQ